jgi:perosamine synthetase
MEESKEMNQSFIMQMRPLFGEEEKRAINDYMDEDGFITEFKRTEKFEQMIADYTGAKHCIVVNNGTISLTLAAMAVGIKAGDEVIVPNYTMIATPNSVKMFGANPVFVDVERETLCLDIDKVKQALTSKTRAIMLVSANGRFPNVGIAAFQKFAEEHNLFLIEDAAQSLGSIYPDGRHVGRAGLVGSFSFSAPKIISTGQGGALITDDDEVASRIRRLKDFGRSGGGNDIHDSIGYNFKFTELQACIGIEQMKKLPARVERKKEIWRRYSSNLAGVSGISLFNHNLTFTAPWFIDSLVADRQKLIHKLQKASIGTRIMYPPINHQNAYKLAGTHPISESIGSDGLWLPSSVQLTNENIDYICDEIDGYLK